MVPTKKPRPPVKIAAREMFGCTARKKRLTAANSMLEENTNSRSNILPTKFSATIPDAIPRPNAAIRMGQPAVCESSVVYANEGPRLSTAPVAAIAAPIPNIMVRASWFSLRNSTPSFMSRPIWRHSKSAAVRAVGDLIGIPLTMDALNANVPASTNSASDSTCVPKKGIPDAVAASTVAMIPPRGSVPYVESSTAELAFASCRRGTNCGSDASRHGVQSSAKHSTPNDSGKIIHSLGTNAIAP